MGIEDAKRDDPHDKGLKVVIDSTDNPLPAGGGKYAQKPTPPEKITGKGS
jgi:hypothetical protein